MMCLRSDAGAGVPPESLVALSAALRDHLLATRPRAEAAAAGKRRRGKRKVDASPLQPEGGDQVVFIL